MATFNELKDSIDNLLNLVSAGQQLQLNSAKREKAFEIYTLALIAEAVRNAGGHYDIVGVQTGMSPSTVVFRAAPGAIYSATQDFAYLDCRLNGKQFEIHADVEFEGSSGASHEMDISLIDKGRADRARNSRRNPKSLLFVAECKFYSSSVPSIGVARALVGLASDFSLEMGSAFVSNDATDNLKNFLSKNRRPDPFPELSPLNKSSEERFKSFVESKLRKWAKV
jgi:hypothetical protein